MDPEVSPSPEPVLSGEKRRTPDGDGAESKLLPPSSKKPRCGAGDLSRVAEIVLVLSAMGRMRGGRDPGEVELGLMAEARERLAAACETLAPKDIVARDAVGRVIDDLGLNGKVRDQGMGFKVPKLSIAEKLAFTRRKMEEARKYPTHTTTYISPSLQGSFGVGADTRGPLSVRTFPSDKPTQPPVSAGGYMASPYLGNVASSSPGIVPAEKPTAVTYHFGPNEARTSTVPGAVSGSHFSGKDSSLAAPKGEKSPDVVEIGSNVAPRTSSVPANSSVYQPPVSAHTWSVPAQPTSLSRFGPDKSVFNHTPSKTQQASTVPVPSAPPLAARDQARRPHLTRATSGQPPAVHHQALHGATAAAPSNHSNHLEIAKVVQKLLLPKLPEHPTWTPPSREYMYKAITCQICQATVNDVESVLLCDACERGYHLRCLQTHNQRGIPKVEWHCQKCLALSHGKPLPPKYGRVMRNMGAPKVTANVTTAEKKVGTADPKGNQEKASSTESSMSQNPAADAAPNNDQPMSSSDVKLPESRNIQGNDPSVREEMQPKSSSQCTADNSVASVGSAFGSPDGAFNERSTGDVNKCETSIIEARSASPSKSETSANESDLSSSLNYPSDMRATEAADSVGDPPEKCEDSHSDWKEAEKSHADDKAGSSIGSGINQDIPHAENNVDPSTGSDAKREKSCAEDNVDSNGESNSKEEKPCADGDIDSNTVCDAKQEKSLEEDNSDTNIRSETKQVNADFGEQDPGLSSVTDVATSEAAALPSDVSDQAVATSEAAEAEWLGDVLEVVDGKAFYGSCCIAGVTYKLNQQALFHSDQGKLVPHKLQAMWEDKITGLKWVKVNRFYFSGDLPDSVGRPFTEANEVFDSNHEEIFMAGTIRGPCEVLHTTKYKEESERRVPEANAALTPLFLCKWFFDESKGHFQAVSS